MIFHISSVYPPKLGGLEKVVRVLASTQKQMGKAVSVITSNQGINDGEIPKDDFEVTRLKSVSIANTTIMPMLLFKLLSIKRSDTAHVHIVQAYTPEIVWLASKVKRFKYIVHIHLDAPPSGPAGFLLRVYKPLILGRVLRAAKFVIVFTSDQKADVIKKYDIDPARVKVVPNGVEDTFYYDEPRTMHKKPRLLFVGRLNYQKNLQQLLHALDGVSDQFDTTIVGSGELESNLKALTKELKLKNVTFTGRQEGDELLGHYKKSDIFVMSSEREGMPLVLLEAMAMGLPVVATNVTGSKDVVKDGKTGLLVPYNDANAFRHALLKIKADSKLYETMSQESRKLADKSSWEKVAAQISKLQELKEEVTAEIAKLKAEPITQPPRTDNGHDIELWKIVLGLLVIANVASLSRNLIASLITLLFFLFVPGYLLLNTLKHGIKSRWEIASFSLGLSILTLMVGGLMLNSLHAFGLAKPLEARNILVMLDAVTYILLALNWKARFKLPDINSIRPNKELALTGAALTLLPLLAVGGAIRLNNGASNVLTVFMLASIALLFLLIITFKNLRPVYPYAIFMMGLAILFATSLRGWSISGHDIQHEFRVFQITSTNGFWAPIGSTHDPYDACLSVTVLPTIISKIASIPAPYVYKVVFQMIFAFGLVPLYLFIKRFIGAQRALIASLVFMSFPPFIEDMPYLNRQEIAFVFFALLMLTTFMNMTRRPKTWLTVLCLLGVILSHYSSAYVTLGILTSSWLFYKLAVHRRTNWQPFVLPALSLPIILGAILFTYIWNAKITDTTAGLRQTVTATINGLEGHAVPQSSGVSYSIIAPHTQSPASVLKKYAGKNASNVRYVPSPNLPTTEVGRLVSHVISVSKLNSFLRSFSAKILQVLLLLGVALFFFKQRDKRTAKDTYLYALTLGCLTLLTLITVLPEISVDYSVTRLFQQTLVITSIAILTGLEFLLSFMKRYRLYAMSIFFAVLFLELSGFLPQTLGGYVAQLSLNNSGQYYDLYYVQPGEQLSSTWLLENRNGQSVAADMYAGIRFPGYPFEKAYLLDPAHAPNAQYLYQDYASTHQGLYAEYINGDVIEYSYQSPITKNNLVYDNQSSRIYHNATQD